MAAGFGECRRRGHHDWQVLVYVTVPVADAAADNESRRLRRSMRDLAEAIILADDLNRKDGGASKVAVRDDSKIM